MKQHVLGAQDAMKSARKRALCNQKHAKNRIYRIAKSLGWVTGARVRIPPAPPF